MCKILATNIKYCSTIASRMRHYTLFCNQKNYAQMCFPFSKWGGRCGVWMRFILVAEGMLIISIVLNGFLLFYCLISREINRGGQYGVYIRQICLAKTSIIFQSLWDFSYYGNEGSVGNIVSKLYTCRTQLQVSFVDSLLFGT